MQKLASNNIENDGTRTGDNEKLLTFGSNLQQSQVHIVFEDDALEVKADKVSL